MDWLTKISQKIRGLFDTLIYGCMFIWLPLLVLAIILGMVYLIATSDLPDWMKWWLLR